MITNCSPLSLRYSASRKRHGFTMVEMIVVVLIASILVTIAQPRIASILGKQQAITLARQIAKDIDTVRQTARAASATKSIAFNSGAKTYTLTGVTNPDRKNAAYVVSLTEYAAPAAFGTVNLGGDAVLIFNGFGLPDSGGSIQVTVGSESKIVVVDAATGSTTIP